jgi:hypothetical protein
VAVRIQLVVTGELERHLPSALQRVFPADQVEFLPTQHTRDLTSTLLPPQPIPPLEGTKSVEFVSHLLAAVDPGKDGHPADFALGLDDVELTNLGNEPAILAHVRAAALHLVEQGIRPFRGQSYTSTRPDTPDMGHGRTLIRPLKTPDRRRDAFRARCSFHLLSPMLEGPLFADSAAIPRARTAPPMRTSRFDPQITDAETFHVTDEDYTAPADDFIPEGALLPAPWARPQRDRHPKHYLQFLLDPTGRERRAYRETHEGKNILQAFDWPTALQPPGHLQRIRALLHDIAQMAGVSPDPAWGPAPTPVRGGVLRNL